MAPKNLLDVNPPHQKNPVMARGAKKNGIDNQLDMPLGVARHPQAITDGIENKNNEYQQIRHHQHAPPELPLVRALVHRCGNRRQSYACIGHVGKSIKQGKGGRATPTHAVSRGRGISQTQLPATALMRANISSTALSTGTFSFKTRFIALA